MLNYSKNLKRSITIPGERERVCDGGVAVNEIQLLNFDSPTEYVAAISHANYETTSVFGFSHPLHYRNAVSVLRGEVEANSGDREGLKSPDLLISADLVARDGRTMSLPLAY